MIKHHKIWFIGPYFPFKKVYECRYCGIQCTTYEAALTLETLKCEGKPDAKHHNQPLPKNNTVR